METRISQTGRLTLATTLAAALAGGAWVLGRSSTEIGSADAAPSPRCGPTCRAAYAAIAKTLPDDRTNVLARAILNTPGFGYPELAKSLNIPTPREIQAQWRRRCNARFPHNARAAQICFRLVLGRPRNPRIGAFDGPPA